MSFFYRASALALTIITFASCSGFHTSSKHDFKIADTDLTKSAIGESLAQMQKAAGSASPSQLISLYPKGVLGAGSSLVRLVSSGALDGALISSQTLEGEIPIVKVLSYPYLFSSLAQFENFVIRSQKLLSLLDPDFRKVGLYPLALFSGGSVSFYGRRPLLSASAFKGLKVLEPKGETSYKMLRLYGALPIYVSASEVQSSLRSRSIEGGEDTLEGYLDQQLFKAAPYYMEDEHMYQVKILVASLKSWNKLSSRRQAVLKQSALAAQNWEKSFSEKEETNLRHKIASNGARLTSVDKESFEMSVPPIYKDSSERQRSLIALVRSLSRQGEAAF